MRAVQSNAPRPAAEFFVASLEDLDRGERRFDTIFAVRAGLCPASPSARTI